MPNTYNVEVVSPDDMIEIMVELYNSKRSRNTRVCILGKPGVGKSKIVRTVTQRLSTAKRKAILNDVRLLTIEPAQMRGLENIGRDEVGNAVTLQIRPEWLPPYTPDEEITDDTPIYVLFLDEIMGCDDIIRKAAFEILTDHRCGPHLLGSNVIVCAAGNTGEDGTNVYMMDTATSDRFAFYLVETSQEQLVDYATRNGWHPAYIAFLNNHPGHLEMTEQDIEQNNIANPSSRTHEACSDILYDFYDGSIGKMTRDRTLAGRLGLSAASNLIAELDDEQSRFDLAGLLKAKKSERQYPKNAFGLMTLANTLAAYIRDEQTMNLASDIMMECPNGATDNVEECKTAFVNAIYGKVRSLGLFVKFAQDDRMGVFLEDIEKLTKEHDEAFAARQAEAAALDEQNQRAA